MSIKNHRTYAQHYGMAQVANICTSRLTHIHNVHIKIHTYVYTYYPLSDDWQAHSREALYARMLKKRPGLPRRVFMCASLESLRGERAHCKNNGRGFFNRERILHCKPVNARFTLVHVHDLLHLRQSLNSNTALGFA